MSEIDAKVEAIDNKLDILINVLSKGNTAVLASVLADDNQRLNSQAVCKLLKISSRQFHRIKNNIPMIKEGSRLFCSVETLLSYQSKKL